MDRTKLLQNPLPVDRVAARVVRGKAEYWVPTSSRNQPYFDTPPATTQITAEQRRSPQFVDLTGQPIGLMRVYGLAAEGSPKGKGHRWVVRCQCSTFILMRAAAIKRAADAVAVCPRCVAKRKIRGLMREDVLRTTVA